MLVTHPMKYLPTAVNLNVTQENPNITMRYNFHSFLKKKIEIPHYRIKVLLNVADQFYSKCQGSFSKDSLNDKGGEGKSLLNTLHGGIY